MIVRLNLKTIKFYLIKLATEFQYETAKLFTYGNNRMTAKKVL